MAKAKYDHNHKYIAASAFLYKCSVPGCPHTISKLLLIGRKAACPDCEAIFTITDEHLRRKRLHCLHCHKEDQMTKKLSPFELLLKEKGL